MSVKAYYWRAKERWVAWGYPDYAPWVPIMFHSFLLITCVVAVAQRVPGGDAPVATLLLSLSGVAYLLGELLGPRFHWALSAALAFGPIGLLAYLSPVERDFLVLATALIVGRFAAIESLRRSGAVFAAVFAGTLAISVLDEYDGIGMAIAILIAGWDIGWMLQMQQRTIDRATRDQADREAKAALQERQRIAREVHDVIAHSLSVTLLHLTAARRDLEDGGDMEEAIDALRDAETVGRKAMADIRQTVGLLGDTGGRTTPAPDLADVPQLVEQFRAAGLDVDLELTGTDARLSPVARTGLYRIVQESLANIAKHEPTARATVVLDLAHDPARLTVRNALTHPAAQPNGGSGLRGMSHRAEQMGAKFAAGPSDDAWHVELAVPNPTGHNCLLPRIPGLRWMGPETA